MSAEASLEKLGIQLPPAPKAIGLYKPLIVVNDLAQTSGHGPLQTDGSFTCGRVGDSLSVDEGYSAAKQAGLAVLATLKSQLGDLDRVVRLVKTLGLVNSTADFAEHPAVINGFSELMRDVFGDDHGVAARSAFGAGSLPGGWAVEIEATFQIK